MNCRICGNPLTVDDKGYYINEKDERYKVCNACWKREKTERIEVKNESNFTKTAFINLINILQLISFIIAAIAFWNEEEILQGFIYLGIGIILFAFIKGFSDIIELLDSINNKIS